MACGGSRRMFTLFSHSLCNLIDTIISGTLTSLGRRAPETC